MVIKITDPSPSKFRSQALLVALVLILIGIGALIIGNIILGGVIALIGVIFGLGSRVAQDSSKD